jgi:hypothetical protein
MLHFAGFGRFFVKTPLILQNNNVIIIHAGYRWSAEIACDYLKKGLLREWKY